MAKLGIFMADGCEEIEGLTVVDIARRGKIDIDMISVFDQDYVTGSHGICFKADVKKSQADFSVYDGIILPGGMPGTRHLGADATVVSVIKDFAAQGKLVAAICAAPSVLGQNGLLKGKKATCYPGFESQDFGADMTQASVVRDGNIITAPGMGKAVDFALEILKYFTDEETACQMAEGIIK